MLNIVSLVFAVLSASEVRSINIMLKKPSVQSGIYTNSKGTYPSSLANDGNKAGHPSTTSFTQNPYWQGDLQGFYTVTSISVTSPSYWTWDKNLKNAIVGVSVHDVVCSESQVTICGQWPDENLTGHTIIFNCTHAGPVRFVRIWREGRFYLSISEVEVEGELSRPTGMVYDKVMLQKVTTPTSSLSVTSATSCGTICHRTQSCLAFSYSPSEQPNCVLATDVSTTSDVTWDSYNIRTCFKMPTCDLSGFL